MDVNASFRSQFNELRELSGVRFLYSNSDFIPYIIWEKTFDLEEDNDPQIRKVFQLNRNIKKIEYYVNKEVGSMAWVFLFEILLKSENYWISQYGDLIKIKRLPIKLVPVEYQLCYPHDMCALGVGVYRDKTDATVEVILTNKLLNNIGVMNNEF